MELTPAQLQVLKTSINAETNPEFVAWRNAVNYGQMASWYNVDSAFIVFKSSEDTANIGDVINYVAVAAMTAANLERLNTFYLLQPQTFEPNHSDQRTYLADTFSGALGGQGQATRDALDALYRRSALRGERIYCTGTGTTVAPGELNATANGDMTAQNVQDALALP
jgi:hypothetical protein